MTYFKSLCLLVAVLLPASVAAQTFHFDFSEKKPQKGYTHITTDSLFATSASGWGYDLLPAPEKGSTEPFFFSVNVPDGNYRVAVTLGSKSRSASTTVRAESRRLFLENVATAKGELRTETFVVNKRNTRIDDNESVRIKAREQGKLNWDDKLTIEINGDSPSLVRLDIERVDSVPTIFLAGNSTVVDQDSEPWASWGQMITRFFGDKVCFANYAESGERADTFIKAGRLKKALSQMKEGDYMFVEFGHNDQKLKGPGCGAYYSFAMNLKIFIDEVRAKGATPIFVTPTQRRSFDSDGHIRETHEDYPDAMRDVAKREGVQVIELHDMTRTLYETLGVDNSRKAFVHYPANTFPNQPKALEDNTHFNPYGAYQIAKCVIEGMRELNFPLLDCLRSDYANEHYSPSKPDDFNDFHWNDSPFVETVKPDGN